MEQTRHIGGLIVLLWIVRVGVGDAYETRRRTHVTGNAVHAHAGTPCAQFRFAPSDRLRHFVAHAHVVAQVFHMEVESRLVGEHIHIVMMNVHAVGHLLDDDASGAVTNEPVQQGLLLAGHDLRNERHVLQRFFDFVDTVEIARHPQREFEGSDVFGSFDRLVRKGGVSGEVQSGNGQAMLVGAVEIHGAVGHDHAHADHRIRFALAFGPIHIVVLVASRSDQNGLAVGEAPVEITAEIRVSLIVGETNTSAHMDSLP